MSLRAFCMAAALAFQAAAAAVAPDPVHFQWQREIRSGGSGQTCVALDAQVFRHAQSGLTDLRLYSGEKEAPYTLAYQQTAPQRSAQPRLLNLGRCGDTTVFDAEMGGPFSNVTLQIDGHDFLADVEVTGSRAGEPPAQPGTRLGRFTIFDLKAQHLDRSTVLHLPPSDFAELHLVIHGPIRPEQVTGILASEPLPGKDVYATIAEITQPSKQGRETVYTAEVPANVPVDRISFTPPATPANFNRSVTVRVASAHPEEGETAADAAFGNIDRIHLVHHGERVDHDNFAIDVPLGSSPKDMRWAITVDNGDDPPLDFSSIRLEMRERDLCFDAAAGADYALYYGDAALSAPRYDYASFFERDEHAQAATLGAETKNASYQPRADSRPFTERHPRLLWLALVLVVLVLGAIALRSAKQVSPQK